MSEGKKFKAGDRVRRIEGDGLATGHDIPLGSVCTVLYARSTGGLMLKGHEGMFYSPKYFELVEEESPASVIELDLMALALIADLNLLGKAEDSLTEHGQLAAAGQVRRARQDMLADLGRLVVEAEAQASEVGKAADLKEGGHHRGDGDCLVCQLEGGPPFQGDEGVRQRRSGVRYSRHTE